MSVRDQTVLRFRATTRPDHLVLLQEDLDLRLEHLVWELIRAGHSLLIEGQDSGDPASFTLGDGLRLCGDAGVLNSRTVREVVGSSIRDGGDVFQLDLERLDHLALMSWPPSCRPPRASGTAVVSCASRPGEAPGGCSPCPRSSRAIAGTSN